jgi:hypothetical protein
MSAFNALGYLANEAERVGCALHELRGTLKAPAGAQGFGLAHYVDDQLLLNLKPHDVPAGTALEEMVGTLKTSTFLCNFHSETDQGPFKFRAWSFVMRGGHNSPALMSQMLAHLPDSIHRNITGDSLGEAVFHRFLAILGESVRLEDPSVPPKALDAALKKTLQLLEGHKVLMMVDNGRLLAGIHNGGGLAYNLREGILACQRCAMDKHAMDSFPLRESHRRFKGVMLAGGFEAPPPGFMPVPAGQTVVVTRKLEVLLQ